MRIMVVLLAASIHCLAYAEVSKIDNLVTQWVQLEQQISGVEGQWRTRKPILEQQLQLLEREKRTLESRLSSNTNTRDGIEEQRQALLTEQSSLEQSQEKMAVALDRALAQLHYIHPQLPPPLKEAWDKEIVQLTALSGVSEQLEKVVFLLDSLDNFSRRIAVYQTSMLMENGDIVQVEQAYLGPSQGWYISRDDQYFGMGSSQATGWQWLHQPNNLTAQQVRQFINSVAQGAQSRLVVMPLSVEVND